MLTLAQHMASTIYGHSILNSDSATLFDLIHRLCRNVFTRDMQEDEAVDLRQFNFSDEIDVDESLGVAAIRNTAAQRHITQRTNPWTIGSAFVTSSETAMMEQMLCLQSQALRVSAGWAENEESQINFVVHQVKESMDPDTAH